MYRTNVYSGRERNPGSIADTAEQGTAGLDTIRRDRQVPGEAEDGLGPASGGKSEGGQSVDRGGDFKCTSV